jgi:hypothetical protein
MTRPKKYDEETVVFGKRVPKSKLSDVTYLVDNFLEEFEINKAPSLLPVEGLKIKKIKAEKK